MATSWAGRFFLTPLDRQLFASALDEARVDWADAQLEASVTHEALTRLLGLWGENVSWELADAMPALPKKGADLGSLESRAIRERLDLSAARVEVDSIKWRDPAIRSRSRRRRTHARLSAPKPSTGSKTRRTQRAGARSRPRVADDTRTTP